MVRCRKIESQDFGAVIELLCEGFPRRSKTYWIDALRRLEAFPVCEGLPRYGHLMETSNAVVGAILVLSAPILVGGIKTIRRNVSSWYVRPQFRLYGPFLARAAEGPPATYINIDPDPPTWPMIEAHGFQRFADGVIACVPAFNFRSERARIMPFREVIGTDHRLSTEALQILRDHEEFGCISLCSQISLTCYPFVFRRRRLRSYLPPCGELIYCRNIADFERFSGPLGRYLALRGIPWVIFGANGPLRGLPGWYFAGKLPAYFKGATAPGLGDLAYTEAAIFNDYA